MFTSLFQKFCSDLITQQGKYLSIFYTHELLQQVLPSSSGLRLFTVGQLFIKLHRDQFPLARMVLFLCLFIFLVLIAVASWYHLKYNNRNKLLANIPSITSYPLIGSNLSFVGKSAVDIFKVLQQANVELGSVYRFDVSPFESMVMVSEPNVIEGILSSQKLIDKSAQYNFVKPWLNEGCGVKYPDLSS